MNKSKIDAAIARLKEPEDGDTIFNVCNSYELLAQNNQELMIEALAVLCESVTMSVLGRRATPEEADVATEKINQSPAVRRFVDSYRLYGEFHVAFAEQAAEVKETMKSGLWTDDATPSRN